jgi:OOP family OmpA-OmpF porin
MRVWPVALMTIAAVTAAHADVDSGAAFRIGLGLNKVTQEVDAAGYSDSATGFEAFGGWELNRYLAAEAGYLDGGKTNEDGLQLDTKGYYASVLGSLWLNDYASLFARAGVLHWDMDVSVSGFGNVGSLDGNDLYYGIGAAGLVDGALLRLEYRRAELEDVDLSMVSLNVAWRF